MRILRKITSLFLLCLVILTATNAQERDSALVAKVFRHGLKDTKSLLLSPAKWDSKAWLIAGSVTAASGALILWGDQAVYNFTNKQQTPSRNQFFKYTEPLGHYYAFAAMGVTMAVGIIGKNNYHVETAIIAAESYLLTGMLVQAVKITAGRNRPNSFGTTNPHQWEGPFFKGQSFFSGHTSTAFAVASVYAQRYKNQFWVPVAAYGLATLVGVERIYDNRHWTSDVVFGAAVGTATGLLLCRQWDESSIRFYPVANPGGLGLAVIVKL